MSGKHESQRLRHTLALRQLQVLGVSRLTPRMVRIVLGGDELKGFYSPSPDDHVKLFFPRPGDKVPVLPSLGEQGLVLAEGVEPSPMRDYTPRKYDVDRNELTVDFVIHGEGPASTWAEQAAPGQYLGVGGPRGSLLIAEDFDTYVMVGDETALPAIGRWLEELPEAARAEVIVEVADRGERQVLTSRAHFNVTWISRDDVVEALETALRQLPEPPGDTFYWVATESRRARELRRYLVEERGIDKAWVKATGYWKADPNDPED
ncbi:MAG TPA: siderophore-interacting protein [Luteibacter sp.]|jgi:NADPH-dependent ferric siderophore reductase|nr:siderophore-interacting protein [Luteibacter sp.]